VAVETTIQVVMPQMGDSVAEGTVLEWRKAEGETVSADETIVEISTDKVDAEVAAPAAGTLVKILAAEGETVTVGSVLGEIAANGSSAPNAPAAPKDGPEAPAPAAPAAPSDGSEAPSAGTVETIDIVTPSAGESVTEGTILEWAVKVGDPVKAGDTVVEISTDKVDVELSAPANGTISELLVNEGDTVTVGQVIGRIRAGGASASAPTAAATAAAENGAHGASSATPTPAAAEDVDGARSVVAPADANGGSNASPVARRLAERRRQEHPP
jgi:2-oxoglutarate decarboxylase